YNPLARMPYIPRRKRRGSTAYFLEKAHNELWQPPSEAISYVISGPKQQYSSHEQLYSELASVWKNASVQLNHLCKSNSIFYFHFLQPNQYVDRSKVLTDEEKLKAYSAKSPYRLPVQHGYPWLKRYGQELIQKGVHFTDLTQLFKDEKETTYRDDCCHLNERGMEQLGLAVGKVFQTVFP
ncbi:MAG: hypothetical protein HY537_01585, partial [Deltaproteobacteria bacterium]|nr:hypothetical protein [Deltaproteobacteria bacterium]